MLPTLKRLYMAKSNPDWRHLAALQMDGWEPVSAAVWVDVDGELRITHTIQDTKTGALSVHVVENDSAGRQIERALEHPTCEPPPVEFASV